MNSPLVSVVVPVYNVEKYLDRCVESVLNQTLRNIELVLVDDGSPDRCPEMCDYWANCDRRIKVVHKQNAGLGMACNSGIEAASGRYVAFVDSDDWIDPGMYAAMVEAAAEHDAQMVFTGLRRVDGNGKTSPMAQADALKIYDTEAAIRAFALGMIASRPEMVAERQTMMSAKVVLYKRNMLIDNNLSFFSERQIISEDLFFNLDCLLHSKTVVELPATFYNYLVNTQSLTLSYRSDRFTKVEALRGELLKRYEVLGPELKTRVDRMFTGYTRSILRQLHGYKCISRAEKRAEFRRIAASPLWKEISLTYPISSMPAPHRLMFRLIANNNFFLTMALLSLERLIKGESMP